MHMDDMAQGKRAPCPYMGCLGLRFGQKLFQTELQGGISRSAPAKQKIWYFPPELKCPSVHNWATHLALSNSRGHLHWSTWATVRNSENPQVALIKIPVSRIGGGSERKRETMCMCVPRQCSRGRGARCRRQRTSNSTYSPVPVRTWPSSRFSSVACERRRMPAYQAVVVLVRMMC